jgi:uncharacterized protein (TIGR02246 family)
MRITFLVVVAVLLTACTGSPETPEQTSARMSAKADTARLAIEAQNARLVEFVAAAEADSFAFVYTEDAVLYPLGSPAMRGRAAIAAALRTAFASGSFTYALRTISVEASDALAIETGQNIMTFTPGPDAPADVVASTDTIIYVAIWQKVGDQWLISKDIGTSDRPTQLTPGPGG